MLEIEGHTSRRYSKISHTTSENNDTVRQHKSPSFRLRCSFLDS